MDSESKIAKRGHRALVACGIVLSALAANSFAQSPAREDKEMIEKVTLFEFQSQEKPWPNVDDVVMGGVSSSRMRIEDSTAIFEGKLSLENNGGFASVRSNSVIQDLTGFNAVRLRVRGDGKRYQFRIRSSQSFDGASYQMTFETEKGIWKEVELSFSDFVAAFRGRVLPDEPPIDASRISAFGFLIADKQEGPFRLEIDWIQAFRN
jgi:NADH dehydrogenase [ubiquinone] 1 alpha subcomplex assembly factor 1